MTYLNKFDEEVDNCPFSTDWDKQRRYVLSIIESYYNQCTFFRYCQTKPSEEEDRIRIIFFELFGCLYVWSECIENGLIESGQLDKVHQYSEEIAFVMYSNIENVSPFAPLAMKLLKDRKLYPTHEELNK